MMVLLVISVAITAFIFGALIVLWLGAQEPIDVRLMEVAARQPLGDTTITAPSPAGFAVIAAGITRSPLRPIRDLITSNDEDLTYRLGLAGFRKPEHVEIYAAAKMLLPVAAIALASFVGDNILPVALIGAALGFFAPDLVVTQLVARRREIVRTALPDAVDLLVICMEAGLGIDQALVRVGEEVRLTCPVLADELQIINREQRAGKPRLDAWRSMAERVDLDFVRQFVGMLVQTERFGTPISSALGQFADSLRSRRMQAAEEIAAKAGIKLLFPLVIFIFPSIFVVLLGPAILNIAKALNDFLK